MVRYVVRNKEELDSLQFVAQAVLGSELSRERFDVKVSRANNSSTAYIDVETASNILISNLRVDSIYSDEGCKISGWYDYEGGGSIKVVVDINKIPEDCTLKIYFGKS